MSQDRSGLVFDCSTYTDETGDAGIIDPLDRMGDKNWITE